MYTLIDDNWSDDYLDYHLDDGGVRIDVRLWAILSDVDDQYITYSTKNWRKVWNYVREMGPTAVFHKIVSRLKEGSRNTKYLSVGVGRILETESDQWPDTGEPVVFLAYNHPKCTDRVAIDERFVTDWAGDDLEGHSLRFFEEADIDPGELGEYAGWSRYSGLPVDASTVEQELTRVGRGLQDLLSDSRSGRRFPVQPNRPTRERRPAEPGTSNPSNTSSESLRAVVFGAGNYAKSTMMPRLSDAIDVECLHELDPLQLGRPDRWDCTLDTSGHARPDEDYDVFFIASFHHTHTPLALQALRKGARAVVEKPICTTLRQYRDLEETLDHVGRNLYCGFHKRFSELNGWALEDLEVSPGDPVHYHCIVYEIPLPERHWYNWPNSGSRIVSNGCHWLDHFMFLNDYVEVRDFWVHRATAGDINVGVELENDASFAMTLTDSGSPRLGVRDYVELKKGDATATLVDNADYESENTHRIIRRESVNRMDSYKRMYQTISRKLVDREPGDPRRSLRSTKLMLDIEQALTNS